MKDENSIPTNPETATNGEPVTGSPSTSSKRRSTRPTTKPKRRKAQPRTLIETEGPPPTTPVEQARLTIGTIVGTHGVHGDLKMRILTDDPDHLKTIGTVYLGDRDTPIGLRSIRITNEGALISLEGTDSPEAGARLNGLAVKISGADARPLEEGEYFLFQLIGLTAYTEDGETIGTVTDLIETGAHDVLVISDRPNSPDDLLVPNHPEFVLELKPETGTVVIRPPEYAS